MFRQFSRLWRYFFPARRTFRTEYRILCGPDLPTLEARVAERREDIAELVGGISSCAWTEPGVGPVQFFTQAVMVWEEKAST